MIARNYANRGGSNPNLCAKFKRTLKGSDKIRIFKITCKINNKVYIGQTTEILERRFRRHIEINTCLSMLKKVQRLSKG